MLDVRWPLTGLWADSVAIPDDEDEDDDKAVDDADDDGCGSLCPLEIFFGFRTEFIDDDDDSIEWLVDEEFDDKSE